MKNFTTNVFCVGNAIVDVISEIDQSSFDLLDIVPGSMNLIDRGRSDQLLSASDAPIESPGGSAANTAAGVASFNGKSLFAGKVANDRLGSVFIEGNRSSGVEFAGVVVESDEATGSSIILVTPDHERTMNTYLGVANQFSESDFDEFALQNSEILFCELYLWDRPQAKNAISKAMSLIDKSIGQKISISLSDTFCVERHHSEVVELIKSIDILFANEQEIKCLYNSDLETSIKRASEDVEIACITLGEKGSIVVTSEKVYNIDPEPASTVIDTTGAGDMYAAGVLFGLTNGFTLKESGRLGSLAAAEVISHFGPRPEIKLSDLI